MEKETPRLSPSIAAKLLNESPLAAWSAHRLLGNHREPPSPSQIEGTLWHAFILGDMSKIEVIDCTNFKTKAAQELRDKAFAEGKTPMAAPKADEFTRGADKIRHAMAIQGGNDRGVIERRVEWAEETSTGKEVLCSGYIDKHNGGDIVELKTGKTATTKRQAMKLIAGSTALFQQAAYRSALYVLDGVAPADATFTYRFVQTRPPWSVTIVKMSDAFRRISFNRWQRAIDLWAECLALDEWRDVTEGIEEVDAPRWLVSEDAEQQGYAKFLDEKTTN